MKKLARAFVLSVAALSTVFVSVSAANAGHRGWRHHHHDNGDAVALGVLGLAAGAIIGGAIVDSNNNYNRRVYIDPPRTYYPPQPTYYPAPTYVAPPPRPYYPRNVGYGGYEPWSPGWYQYCESRYRSFDPSTGTFRGYDGREHFCTVN
jgi:hypothetical protein